jgi:hypothetical protein
MAKDEFSHMTVGELKALVKKYKKVHCKPFSKLDRAGLIALAKEIESHERKVEVIPKLSAEEVEKALKAKKEAKTPRMTKKMAELMEKDNDLSVKEAKKKADAEKAQPKVKAERKKRVVTEGQKSALKNVQALKKARGVSLKEAWALHKAGEKVKVKRVIKMKKEEKN